MGKYQIRIYDIPGSRLNEAAEYDIDSDLDAIDALKSELCNHPDAAYVEVERDGKIIWTWNWNQAELARVARRVGDRIWHAPLANAALAAWSWPSILGRAGEGSPQGQEIDDGTQQTSKADI